MAATSLTEETVLHALRGVVDPELGDDVVDLGMVRRVSVAEGGRVTVELALTVASCPLRSQLRGDVKARLGSLPGVEGVQIEVGTMSAEERKAVMSRARWKARQRADTNQLSPSARVVAVASGKGGVGKSSVTVNLAASLASRGYTVGLLDADIWGFSVPRMLGLEGRLEAEGTKDEWAIVPAVRPLGEGQLKVVSMGLLSESEGEAIMWRGLLLNRAVQHFIQDVRWGPLDYLLVDMPPGTGDIQMGLARTLPRTEVLIVTTPPQAAARVAARVADMARKGWLRVAGVIENMSTFTCDHGTTYELFGSGGGQALADEIGVPFVGSVPFDPAVAAGGDAGRPAVLDPSHPVAAAFMGIVDRLLEEIVPPVEMSGCTARLLERMEGVSVPSAR